VANDPAYSFDVILRSVKKFIAQAVGVTLGKNNFKGSGLKC
jgi:hypothetical protein